jgi:acetyltransferase-like isoleucine patch superfamily enzyme
LQYLKKNNEELGNMKNLEHKQVQLNNPFKNYRNRITGGKNLFDFIKYEIFTFFLSKLPCAAGIYLRQKFYKFLLGKFGTKIMIGNSVTFRNPEKIFLSDKVMIDEYSCLDVKSADAEGIFLGENVILERNCHISTSYVGYIRINKNSSIGVGTQIWGAGGVDIGENVLIGGNTFISTVNHNIGDTEKSIMEQGSTLKAIKIENDCWLGANVIVLPGVTIGEGSVIGAGSVVTKDIPSYSISYGVPARIVDKRGKKSEENSQKSS